MKLETFMQQMAGRVLMIPEQAYQAGSWGCIDVILEWIYGEGYEIVKKQQKPSRRTK